MTGNIAAEIEAGALLFTSIATADIDVAIERIDLSDWLFELPSAEYEYCSADHIACGTTLSPEGRRMSINVEAIGNDVLVQHYIEEATSPLACRVVSISDLFHRLGQATIGIVWDFSVEPLAEGQCRFTNRIFGHATPELYALFAENGVALAAAAAQMQALTDAHNQGETPRFAANIAERASGQSPQRSPVPALGLEAPILVESHCTAVVHAPIERLDLPAWVFSLSDSEYQACSVAHYAAGASRIEDGRRLSINVEKPDSLLIQKYQEVDSTRDRCRVVSPRSDLFGPAGRSTLHVTWDISLRPLAADTCELLNLVELRTTPEFEAALEASGAPIEAVKAQLLAVLAAHNEEETPKFAADMARTPRPLR